MRRYEDILTAKRDGKIGIIIGAQSCDFIHHPDISESVEAFARLGLRIMTIAYNHRTFAADGCATGTDDGLTCEGKTLIRAMERNGIVVDLSHVGRRSTLEAMDFCEKPAIFSHSNAYALYPHFRNITDEQIKACAARGQLEEGRVWMGQAAAALGSLSAEARERLLSSGGMGMEPVEFAAEYGWKEEAESWRAAAMVLRST